MLKRIMTVLIGSLIVSGPLFAATENAKSLARAAMLAQKKAVVAMNMNLSENEEKPFWPIYDTYQIELNKLNAELEAITMKFAINFNDMTEALSKELRDRALKLERDRLQLKKATCDSIQDALGAKIAGRFYQVENKIDSAVRSGMASEIPLLK